MAAENKLAPAPNFHDWHKPLILLKNRIMKLYFPIGNKNFGKRILYSKISLVLLQSIFEVSIAQWIVDGNIISILFPEF